MELNIEKAKALFPDAIKLQLRINGPATVLDIRRLLPNSVVMLSCNCLLYTSPSPRDRG